MIDHPVFQSSPDETYRDLFVAGSADPLPTDLASLRQAEQTSQVARAGFHQLAAERKTYAAVAFQYLAEDLMLKATEMNEVIRRSRQFSMTEAQRMRLRTFAEDYLVLAGQMLERSDALLLDVASVKPLRQQPDQQQQQLERATIAPNEGTGLLINPTDTIMQNKTSRQGKPSPLMSPGTLPVLHPVAAPAFRAVEIYGTTNNELSGHGRPTDLSTGSFYRSQDEVEPTASRTHNGSSLALSLAGPG